MCKQLTFIHGGQVFEHNSEFESFLNDYQIEDPFLDTPKSWKQDLFAQLEEKGWQILAPKMPCKSNSKYKHWKIWFEKFLPFIKKESMLVGHSLGGSFFAKYFQENEVGKFAQLHLVSPAYNLKAGGFTHKDNFSLLEKQFNAIYIYHSKNDPVVPFEDSEHFHRLIPKSKFIQFENKHHFILDNSPEIEKFLPL